MDLPIIPPRPAPAPADPTQRAAGASKAQLERLAKEFEASALSALLRPMFDSVAVNELTGGGVGEQTFRPMLVEQYAKAIADRGGVGFGQAILRELTRLQEASSIVEPAQAGAPHKED